MSLKLLTPPAAEPILPADAKTHLRLDPAVTAEDALVNALIGSARQQAEYETGRALITQTWQLVLDAFPAGEIQLALPPVQSITSVTYIDTTGALQTLSSALYTVDAVREPARLVPAYGATWPSTRDATPNAVTVTFVCGYGAAGTAVPAAIRQWMLLQIGALYRNRESFVDSGKQPAALPGNFVSHLLDPFRVYL
jgi:uncharacterized phiE125 gp8 family phage protein